MTDNERHDPVWDRALDWIMREHDESFDESEREALHRWLAESPTHQNTYEEARVLWLATGLIPSSDEQSDPEPD